MGQVRDGRRGDIAPPGVFDRHGDAQGNAEIADLAGLGDAADLGDLEIDNIHGPVLIAAQDLEHVVDYFVKHHGAIGVLTNRQTLLVVKAGLLQINVVVTDGVGHAHGLMLGPTGVGIGHQNISRLQSRGRRLDALDVGIGVAANL